MALKRLNLGCGADIKKGWINLDSANLPGVDIVHNIEKLPLPFKDEEFDEILCQDILEHIEYISLLRELYRILKKGCKLKIRVPHFTSKNNFIDPTHLKLFSIRTFEFFIKKSRLKIDHYFDYHFDKIAYTKITFEKGFYVYNYLVEPIVNSNRKMKNLYESTFLSRIFPAQNIIVELVK